MKDEQYYVDLAKDHLGSAVRDNSRAELLTIGQMIDNGEWDEE
jgi:hypothetical protein